MNDVFASVRTDPWRFALEMAMFMITVLTLVFYGGQLSQRVESIEKDVEEFKYDFKDLRSRFNNYILKNAYTGELHEREKLTYTPGIDRREWIYPAGYASCDRTLVPVVLRLQDNGYNRQYGISISHSFGSDDRRGKLSPAILVRSRTSP